MRLPSKATLKQFGAYLILQGMNKVLTMAQGLLVIHLLSKTDYGFYAVALAAITSVSSFGNAGIGMFISAKGGKYINDAKRMASIAGAARKVQRQLLYVCVVVLMGLIPYQYVLLGISDTLTLCSLTILCVLFLWVSTNSTVNHELLSIALAIRTIQVIDLAATILRITIFAILGWAGLMNVVSILAVSAAISAIWLLLQEKALNRLVLTEHMPVTLMEDVNSARRIIYPQLPNAIYYSFQSQIPILLFGVFGAVKVVAEYSALGRLGQIFSYAFDVLNDFFMPRIGRCQDPHRLGQMIVAVLAGFYAVIASMLFFGYIFRHELLWLLGSKYSGLSVDLPWALLLTGLSSISGSLFLVNSSRAWVGKSWIFIVTTIATQIASIPLFDLSTIRGMILFSMMPNFPFIVTNILFMLQGLKKAKADAQQADLALRTQS